MRHFPFRGVRGMSNSIYERYVWFDAEARRNRYPNAPALAGRFEICVRTARRNIEFMTDRLGAPLEYDQRRRGYFYTDTGYSLPPIILSQEELLAALAARHVLAKSSGGALGRDAESFLHKIHSVMNERGLSPAMLDDAFSAEWPGFSPADPAIFRAATGAMLASWTLRIAYASPESGAVTERVIEPHHIQHYQGSWLLIAFCRVKSDWRKFFLSRITGADVQAETFTRKDRCRWNHQAEGAFGLFRGPEAVTVVLRFTPFRARWIREQVWHTDQAMRELEGGGLELSFPAADFRELRMRILQFGADVEVLAPEALCLDVAGEARKTAEMYEGKRKNTGRKRK